MSKNQPVIDTPWDDPAWKEAGDSAWARGLRWQQGWWRATRLDAPPGPFDAAHPDRLVNSALPLGSAYERMNFLSDRVAEAADRRLAKTGGGLVKEDRLRRNLLSSQPLCFNLFGHHQDDPDALLPWLRSLGCRAARVTAVELEWAPPKHAHFGGGSAFDAFIEYRLGGGGLGFIGVECKYAEDLLRSDVKHVRTEYKMFTEDCGRWRDAAVDHLDTTGLRQLWLNTLLAQSLAAKGGYVEGRCIVVACAEDLAARAAVQQIRAELVDPQDLTWHSYDEILETMTDEVHVEWRGAFVDRYIDFTPIQHLLNAGDPRHTDRADEPADLTTALSVAQRVLGEGSVLERLDRTQDVAGASAIWRRLDVIVDDLRRLRIDADTLLDQQQPGRHR